MMVGALMQKMIEDIRKRLFERDENYIILITGKSGSGKSSASLLLAMLIDPKFTVDRVCFDALGFIRMVNQNLPRGSVIIWDESGVDLDCHEWWKKETIKLGKVLQTFRYQNLCVIFTVPYDTMMNLNARKLAHTMVVMKKKNTKKMVTSAKWYDMSFNVLEHRMDYKLPVLEIDDEDYKVEYIEFEMPQPDLWRQYREKSFMFKRKLAEETQREMEAEYTKRRPRPKPQTRWYFPSPQGGDTNGTITDANAANTA